MDSISARILDANGNRAREALRVLEDYARFGLNDAALSAQLKTMRHTFGAALAALGASDALLARDTPGDVGTQIKTPQELVRESLADVVIAAGKRLSESLRVLEELAKATHPTVARDLERLRYEGYAVEKTLTTIVRQSGRCADVRLYVLLTEELCRGPWVETLDAVLAGGAQCVQLREKRLEDRELLRRAEILVEKCSAAGALAIVNDRPDIALVARAHGVHLGQTDLPCAAVRRLVGHDMIVGVSTENLAQACAAVRDGATYVGVGPMFPTTTKEKPRLAGPAYAREAIAALPLPCVAIGGITALNVGQLTAEGVRCIAVCAAVISDADPAGRCRELRRQLDTAQ